MKADKTREILEISHSCEEGIAICESKYFQCKTELDELERLARIGRATEKVFEEWPRLEGYCYVDEDMIVIDRVIFGNVQELIEWAESED